MVAESRSGDRNLISGAFIQPKFAEGDPGHTISPRASVDPPSTAML
jgi:hypothetical protein